MAGEQVDFFYGAMSPYSWLAAERIDELLPQARWRPIFLGGLFKQVGRVSWGVTELREAEMAECERRAERYGLPAMHWPQRWPTNDLTAARAMVFARSRGLVRELSLQAMRLAFVEARDLGERATVLEAGERAGIEAGELERALEDEEVKSALRGATEEAFERGVIGVPTVAVGERLFWGDDRLPEAVAAAS